MPVQWQRGASLPATSMAHLTGTLSLRHSTLSSWVKYGALPPLALHALPRPGAILAAAKQCFARSRNVPLEAVTLSCKQWSDPVPSVSLDEGVFMSGLTLQQAEEVAAGFVLHDCILEVCAALTTFSALQLAIHLTASGCTCLAPRRKRTLLHVLRVYVTQCGNGDRASFVLHPVPRFRRYLRNLGADA